MESCISVFDWRAILLCGPSAVKTNAAFSSAVDSLTCLYQWIIRGAFSFWVKAPLTNILLRYMEKEPAAWSGPPCRRRHFSGPTGGLSPFSAGLPQKPLDMESTTGGMIDGQTQQRSGKELISWQKSKRQAEPSWAISPRHSRS